MNDDPIRNDARKATRERRLGESKVCWLCGETDERVLVLHWHHPAGRTNVEHLRVRLCLNCHARHHSILDDEGLGLEHRSALTVDRLPDILVGNGSYFSLAGDLVVQLGRHLDRLFKAFDRSYPDWRQLPEANLD